MQLKTKYYYQRLIKQHIDAALMRRKVESRRKRSRRIACRTQQQNIRRPLEVPALAGQIRQNDDLLVMPLIEYTTIWGDVEKVNPLDFLKGIPTIRALEFIVSLQNKVIYAPSDLKTQAQLFAQMISVFEGEELIAIQHYVHETARRGQAPILMDNYSCLHFYLLALQDYNPTDRALTIEDYRNIYKAYLYCSHVWLVQQQRNIKGVGLTDLSILIDLPVVEFKLYKDFKAQLYKATSFFDFCSQNAHFGQFAQWFLEDKGVTTASEYLGRIFNLFSLTAKEPTPVYIQANASQAADIAFFDQYVINPEDCKQLWDTRNINYLRNHFLLKTIDSTTGDTKLMILNTILLVDKLYQGMMFDLSESVLKRGGGNYKGKPFKTKGDFNTFIGDEFSEQQIFYDAMEMAYSAGDVLKFNGSQLKANGVTGELDYCMVDGDRLFFFEYKDVMISDETKRSSDIDLIKETILDRVCKYEKKRRKGVGQLLFNANRIFNEHLLDEFGVNPSKIKEVFLVVVTTDTAFNAIGVNALIREEYARIKERLDFTIPARMVEPAIIDFESLFSLIIPLREKKVDLGTLINQYLNKTRGQGSKRMMPFFGYIKDYYRVPLLKENDVPILFGGFLDMIKKELAKG